MKSASDSYHISNLIRFVNTGGLKNYSQPILNIRGFFEGVKMAQVGYNWKGTVAPVLIE